MAATVEREPRNASAAEAPLVPSNPIPPSADQSGTPLNDLQVQLFRFLYENKSPAVNAAFEKVEKSSNVKREHLTYVSVGMVALYLVVGSCAELVCNLISFAYPCYASTKAIRSTDKTDDTMWLTYWTTFAGFSILDFWAEDIYAYFPFWWLFKASFLFWLSLPQTRGAEKLFTRVIDPVITKVDQLVVHRGAKME